MTLDADTLTRAAAFTRIAELPDTFRATLPTAPGRPGGAAPTRAAMLDYLADVHDRLDSRIRLLGGRAQRLTAPGRRQDLDAAQAALDEAQLYVAAHAATTPTNARIVTRGMA